MRSVLTLLIGITFLFSSCGEKTAEEKRIETNKLLAEAEGEINSGDYEAAIELLKDAREIEKERAVIYSRLGHCYEELEKYGEASAYYGDAVVLGGEPINLLYEARAWDNSYGRTTDYGNELRARYDSIITAQRINK